MRLSKGDSMMGFRWAAMLAALGAAAALPAQDKNGKGGRNDQREERGAEFGAVAGPTIGKLTAPGKGTIAEIKVPPGDFFIGQPGAAQFATATRNNGGDKWAGVLVLEDGGFIVFEFLDTGYIKDADKEKIDADKLMTDMKAGDEEENKARKERGWPAIHIEGWADTPYYDPQTKNLTWAIKLRGEGGGESINHEVRLLGREGVMQATLVCSPQAFAKAKPQVNPLLAGFNYTPGHTYAEWKPGDKVAAYGLAGLIAGGATYGAAKLGLLSKLGVFFTKGAKAIILVGVAIVAAIGKFFSSIFGRRRD